MYDGVLSMFLEDGVLVHDGALVVLDDGVLVHDGALVVLEDGVLCMMVLWRWIYFPDVFGVPPPQPLILAVLKMVLSSQSLAKFTFSFSKLFGPHTRPIPLAHFLTSIRPVVK